jgi:hypothetical protein
VRGKLNLFQRAMLQWRELHPYSAVHAVRLPQPLDKARLAADIADELQALGLTGLEVDARRGQFSFRGGPAQLELRVLSAGEGPAMLEREFETQLNTPFVHSGVHVEPFRFFALDAGSSFYLGLAYDHFIAGGDSIIVLMKRLVQRHQGGAPGGMEPPLALYAQTFRRLFFRYPGHAIAALGRLPGLMASSRRCCRSPLSGKTDLHNGYASFRVGADELAALSRASSGWGATLNDLFLAMILLALSPRAEGRRRAARRRELAVASIMNIRREFQPEADRLFGQFLSSFRVRHPVPAGIALPDLVADVRMQTARIKSSKLYLQTLFALAAGNLAWRHMSPEHRRGFFAKNFPVWAGVTSLNVDPLWPRAESRDHPVEYVRAASTGPLSPLIFAFTRFAGGMHLGVVFRPAAFSRDAVEDLVGDLLCCVKTVAA